MEYIYVGAGGIIGAVARYGLSKWVDRRWQGKSRLATFFINISGSFILGIMFIIFSNTDSNLIHLKNLTTMGILGAYTTYSTFTYELISLVEDGKTNVAVKYFFASIIIGLIAAFLGMFCADLLYVVDL